MKIKTILEALGISTAIISIPAYLLYLFNHNAIHPLNLLSYIMIYGLFLMVTWCLSIGTRFENIVRRCYDVVLIILFLMWTGLQWWCFVYDWQANYDYMMMSFILILIVAFYMMYLIRELLNLAVNKLLGKDYEIREWPLGKKTKLRKVASRLIDVIWHGFKEDEKLLKYISIIATFPTVVFISFLCYLLDFIIVYTEIAIVCFFIIGLPIVIFLLNLGLNAFLNAFLILSPSTVFTFLVFRHNVKRKEVIK